MKHSTPSSKPPEFQVVLTQPGELVQGRRGEGMESQRLLMGRARAAGIVIAGLYEAPPALVQALNAPVTGSLH